MDFQLTGKKIILAVSGSIAAYKSLVLTRLLVKNGAEVKVVMTEAATHFVSALSFSTLSKNDVHATIFSDSEWNNHVDLGLWADALIVAPATANTIGKMANGLVDNMLTATYLSAKCPVFVAPAMDLDMWKHASTQNNLDKLRSYGNFIIPVGNGELASGLSGDGRLAEPEDILSFVAQHLLVVQDFKNKKVLVTAGPTYEDIDPVRYIGNRSTGKMGIAIAEALYMRGADITLISGPTSVSTFIPEKNIIPVRSAEDMYTSVTEHYPYNDGLIMAAAVADYTPRQKHEQKFKKKDGDWAIELKRTKDIAAACGELKKSHQVNVGFALETQNEMKNAKGKLERKKFDMIVLNSLNDKGAGFGHDTNKIQLIRKDGTIVSFPLQSKKLLANHIIDAMLGLFK